MTEIKDVITSSTSNIRNTINLVSNVKNTFEDFKSQMNSVLEIPFDFTEFLQFDFKFDDEFNEFINGDELPSIFKDTIMNIKYEFASFIKSEMMETIEILGVN